MIIRTLSARSQSCTEKNQDANVASADTMKDAVKQVLKKEGVWK